MLKSLIALICLFSFSTFANEGGHDTNLFPPKKADKSLAVAPAKISLTEPAFMAKVAAGNITLKWTAAETADAYHVQVATDPNFKWLIADDFMYKGTSFELKGLEKSKSYYWRVAPRKSDNNPSFTKGWFATSMFETL